MTQFLNAHDPRSRRRLDPSDPTGSNGSETLQKLRKNKKFPTIWCSGCGIGVVMGALIRAIDHLGLDNDHVALVAGIGCTARMPVYMDFNTLHTTHGRALAFATGLKIARPDMKVIAIMGDGDALAIGGNHFIHAARRNLGITALVVNNAIYGMTGGQYSPTTPLGGRATTAPYGNVEPPFPICDLAIAAGATYVARSTVYHALELDKYLAEAIAKDWFQPGRSGFLLPYHLWPSEQAWQRRRHDALPERQQHSTIRSRPTHPRGKGCQHQNRAREVY